LRVDLILKLLENENQNENRIRNEVEKILAKKDQITEFMLYPKKVKENKLKKYKSETQENTFSLLASQPI